MTEKNMKYKCCPYCGASAENIVMEVPTIVEFELTGNCTRGKMMYDYFDLLECSEDESDGNFCRCTECNAEFKAFVDDKSDDYAYYFRKD